MRKKIEKFGRTLFSVGIIVALGGSGIVFLTLLISVVLGNQDLAVFARYDLMPWFIRSAAIGLVGGLISIYASGKHHLTID